MEDDNLYRKSRTGKPLALRTWAASPELFPCELPESTLAKGRKAVQAAVEGWGKQRLTPLEAEDRLSIACEKGASEDPVTLQLREAFQVRWRGKERPPRGARRSMVALCHFTVQWQGELCSAMMCPEFSKGLLRRSSVLHQRAADAECGGHCVRAGALTCAYLLVPALTCWFAVLVAGHAG